MEGLVKLDRIDINILVELQKDGRMTNVSLADAVGFPRALACSASNVWSRLGTSPATRRTSTSQKSPNRSPCSPKSP